MQQNTTNPTIDDDEYTNADLYGPVTELPSTSQPTAEVSKSTPTSASFSRWTQKCAECNRVFDMDVDIDANEWQYGHDCETPTDHDDAPAHGMPRPRFPLAWCQWCRTIDCVCM